jgi:hypothetical protein
VTNIAFLIAAFWVIDPLLKGLLIGLAASIFAYFVISVLESTCGIKILLYDLIQQKLSYAGDFLNQGLVRSFNERTDVKWRDFDTQTRKRFWACGTTLRQLAEHRDILSGLIKRNIQIKIILPSTSELENSFRQLREFDENLPHDQIESARRCLEMIFSHLSPDENQNAKVKLYKGIMYENITIYDNTALVAFYNMTGVGDRSWTLQFEGLGSKGLQYAENEFKRMWKASEPVDNSILQRPSGESREGIPR